MININNRRKGSALVIVMIIMIVLSILGTVILRVAVAENNFPKRNEDKLQAYYIARSGAQAVAEYMIKDNNNDADELIDNDSEWNDQIGNGRFKLTVNEDPTSKVVSILSVGEYNGIQQNTKIEMVHSSSGIGGIFDYAIAVKDKLILGKGNGKKTEIHGSIATKKEEEDSIKIGEAEVIGGDIVTDPSLILPPIDIPSDYDGVLGNISSTKAINSSESGPIYYSANYIDLNGGHIEVTGDGIVHLYVNGNIRMWSGSSFKVADDAKLYVYVIPEDSTVKFGGKGEHNNIFLYAPNSRISWNNAQPHSSFKGSIIGNTVELNNQLYFEYDPEMAEDVDLDKDGVGIKYTGYKWKD